MYEQNAQLIWQKTCDQFLEKEIPKLSFVTWFKPIEPMLDPNGTFILSVPNELTRDFVIKYQTMIENALKLTTNVEFPVEVAINATEQIEQLNKILRLEQEQSVNDSYKPNDALNPLYTFDSFVVGAGNRFAHAACVAVASMQGGKNYNPLFLYGGSGLGKTHLMHAIGNYVQSTFPDKKVVYVNSENFINDFIEAIKEKEFDPFRNKYRMADILLIDDIQFLENKERMQEEFFHTFNTLYEAGKHIVLTCDKPPQSLATLEERLKTRFASGLTIDINPPDYETRVAILRRLAQTHQTNCPDEVFDYIASNISSNIRELEGAFKTLFAYTMLGNAISLESARSALKDQIQPNHVKRLTSDLIMSVVANYYHVSVDDLLSKKRSQDIVLPRQIAMYQCRNLMNMTFKDIGDVFGGKNHATVIHACEKMKEEEEINGDVRHAISEINLRLAP